VFMAFDVVSVCVVPFSFIWRNPKMRFPNQIWRLTCNYTILCLNSINRCRTRLFAEGPVYPAFSSLSCRPTQPEHTTINYTWRCWLFLLNYILSIRVHTVLMPIYSLDIVMLEENVDVVPIYVPLE
jgi:hypothetical protein